MSQIHPFEVYKMFLKMRNHFTKMKFSYQNTNMPNMKYGDFIYNKHYKFYMELSSKEEDYIEKLFLANFVKNSRTQIFDIVTSSGTEILKDFRKRIDTIGELFVNDLKYILHKLHCSDFTEMCLALINYKNSSSKIKVDNIYQVFDIDFKKVEKDDFFYNMIEKCAPESLVILNEIIFKKYHIEFLMNAINNEIEPEEDLIKIYKYQPFVNVDFLINKHRKIQQFNQIIMES